jgi:Holliday junction resolvase
MTNKNYVKGANFERTVKKFYENFGFLVFRTAGSHSPADLIAFPILGGISDKKPILIQCKATEKNISKAELNELSVIAQKYGLHAKLVKKWKGAMLQTWVVE